MSRSLPSLSLSASETAQLLRLFPGGLVALDVESTGLSPLVDKIIEIAAVKVSAKGEVTTFHSLVNPLIDVPPFTVQFHGLTNDDLQTAPTIKRPLRDFWDFVGRLPVIGHNSTFDLGWLIKASHDHQVAFPPLDVYDSCRWARGAYKQTEAGPPNFKLSTLANFLGFELRHHFAMEDSIACLKIMAAVATLPVTHDTCRAKSFVFRLSQFESNDCFNFSTRLRDLPALVQQKGLLSLEYRGTSVTQKTRPVRPIGLMPLPNGPVLFGECLLTGMNKSFLLKKIKSFAPLEASYWRPA